MSDYREEANKYKAKRIGQIDAKVVAPKGRKKKVEKPWVVCYIYAWRGLSDRMGIKPYRKDFAKEADARHEYDKRTRQVGWYKDVWIEHNGKKVD